VGVGDGLGGWMGGRGGVTGRAVGSGFGFGGLGAVGGYNRARQDDQLVSSRVSSTKSVVVAPSAEHVTSKCNAASLQPITHMYVPLPPSCKVHKLSFDSRNWEGGRERKG
jgi:hypothetical protein